MQTMRATLMAKDWPKPLLIAVTVLAFTIMYLPLLVIAMLSFSNTRIAAFPLGGFTMRWYGELFTDPEIRTAVLTTVIASIGALVGSSLVGIPVAFAAYRYEFRGKGLLKRLLYMPVVLPGLVNGFVVLNWITMLHLPQGLWAVIAVYACVMGAIVFSMTYARLLRLDTRLEEAALDLGATRRETLRFVILPALKTTLIGIALTILMLSLEDLLAIYFLIGNGYNIQMLVWSRLRVELTPELHALATVIFVFSALVVVGYSVLLERERRTAGQ